MRRCDHIGAARKIERTSKARTTLGRRGTLGIGRYRREDLLLIKELVDTGKYRPVIDRRYALNEIVWRTQTTDFWVSFKVFGIMPLTIAFALAHLSVIALRFRESDRPSAFRIPLCVRVGRGSIPLPAAIGTITRIGRSG